MRRFSFLLIAAIVAVPLGAQESSRLRVSLVGQAAHVRTARGATVAPERDVALQGRQSIPCPSGP
jgi:hypothetical protein